MTATAPRPPAPHAWTPLLLGLALLGSTCQGDPKTDPVAPVVQEPLPSRDVPTDLGRRAYGHVERLCAMGPRHAGTTGWERAIDHIAGTLDAMGLVARRDTWVDPKERIRFTNVVATLPGARPERLVIGCHHDTKVCEGHDDPLHNFPFVGANDSGSGVGLLLEIARELCDDPLPCTVELVFFDGEESVPFKWDHDRALFGSRRYVEHYLAARENDPSTPPIRAMVLLDMVGAASLQIDDDEYSDPRIKAIVLQAARQLGHADVFYANRLPVRDDHLPFVDAGIPSIDLIDIVDNPQWHTPDDTLEHVSAASLQIVGEVVLTALPEIARQLVVR